jgi:type IV pilus assembly protein PilW
MNARARLPSTRGPAPAAGFTLVELMVAMTVGLVIVLGFAVTFVNMKVTFNTQDKLSQLQDNERIALSMLTSSLQQAGYYSNCADPTTVPITPPSCSKGSQIIATPSTGTPANGATAAAQSVMGTAAGGASTPETLSTMYGAVPGDGTLTCQGTTIASSVTKHVTIRNTFYVFNNALGCTVDAYDVTATATEITGYPLAFAPLVSNVVSMSVMYAMASSPTGAVIQYQGASSIPAANWVNAKGAQITLSFINPNASLGGASSGPITWVQNVNLMNNK